MSFAKSHVFQDSLWNWQLKLYLVSRARSTKTRTQDPRSIPDSFWCHEFDDSLIFRKTSFLWKLYFLRWVLLSRFSWNCNNLIYKTLFWKLSILLNSCWLLGFNFKRKSIFWLTDKISIFWTILLLRSEMWNWSSGAIVNV